MHPSVCGNWKNGRGRPTKVPFNPRTGEPAKTNDPNTFSDFNTAMKAYVMGGWDDIHELPQMK